MRLIILYDLIGYSLNKLNISIVFSGGANYIQDAIYFSILKKLDIKIVIIQRESRIYKNIKEIFN